MLIIHHRRPEPSLADEQARTIYISIEGITPRVRRMSEANKTKLFNNGKRALLHSQFHARSSQTRAIFTITSAAFSISCTETQSCRE